MWVALVCLEGARLIDQHVMLQVFVPALTGAQVAGGLAAVC